MSDPSFIYDERDRIDTELERREPPGAPFRVAVFKANGEVGAHTNPGDLEAVKGHASHLRHLYPAYPLVIQWYDGEEAVWKDWEVA